MTTRSFLATRRAALWTGAFAALWLLFSIGGASAQDQLGGAYRGIDQAQGWTLTLNPRVEGGFDGLLTDRAGVSTPFLAGGDGNVAEARLELIGIPIFMRFSPRPVGLMSWWIPIDPSGALKVEETESFAFVRNDISLPDIPERLAHPPETIGAYMEPLAFLRSYEFWQPQEVGRGYVNLSERFRALIRLYAHVHTDVLWKLCQSRGTPPGITEALQGQNTVCAEVLGKVADAQRTGAFERYKSDLAAQKQMLIDAVRCTQGGLTQEQCVTVSKFTSQAAISLETAATVLSRY